MRYCPNDACPYLPAHGTRSTFQDHVEKCLDCGAALAGGEPPGAPPEVLRRPDDMPLELVTLASFRSSSAAQSAFEALEQAGIPSMVTDPHSDRRSKAGRAGEVALQVRADDVDEARRVLGIEEGAEQAMASCGAGCGCGPAPDPETLEKCPGCGGTHFEVKSEDVGFFKALFGGAKDAKWFKVCEDCGLQQEYD